MFGIFLRSIDKWTKLVSPDTCNANPEAVKKDTLTTGERVLVQC